jgi:hypothetical protein
VKVSDSPVWNESFEFYTSNPLPSRFEKDATGGPRALMVSFCRLRMPSQDTHV